MHAYNFLFEKARESEELQTSNYKINYWEVF